LSVLAPDLSVLAPEVDLARRLSPMRVRGVASAVRGMTVLAEELPAPVGSLVRVGEGDGALGEIVGFSRGSAIIMMLGGTPPIRPGERVEALQSSPIAMVGASMLGRVVDALGRPIDGKGPLRELSPREVQPPPLSAMNRARITKQLKTGVRAIDLMTPLGRGQRIGLFAGPGVGKSTLLSQIARGASSDANVIGLIGERGREVKDFIADALGEEGLARSVVVVATGDESPLMRVRASKLACTIGEHLRDRGRDVLLMIDSVTRLAHAQRQIGLSVGEPPATRGYTPSVFAQMAVLLERAGLVETGGSITGLYTVLVEGDDMSEPVADAARGILDGHIMLSRRLAQRAHYPAIDVLDSVSRVADDVTTPEMQHARRTASRLLAVYRDVEDLVQIGAYAKGSSAESDAAIELQRAVNDILRQGGGDKTTPESAAKEFLRVTREFSERCGRAGGKKG